MTEPSQNKYPLGERVPPASAHCPSAAVLKGRYGRLEKWDLSKHGRKLWENIQGHDALWTYMRTGPFTDERDFSHAQSERIASTHQVTYVILNQEDRALGMASYMAIRPEMQVLEIGNIFYSPALQRTVLGTETQYLLMRYAFENLGYRRYEWKCNALNAASRLAAERYGFTFEGIFRQHEIMKGHNRDTAWYSILDKEWPALKLSFERWLKPDNFDADGKQKTSLRHPLPE